MRARIGFITALSTGLILSCSAAEPDAPEGTGQSEQAIVGSCTVDTFGLPCDADGPLGVKLECEGVCTISGATAEPACVALSAAGVTAMNGAACGTLGGVGDGACAHRCYQGACINLVAPAGAACRPGFGNNTCDGACDGAGKCSPVGGSA